MSAFRGSYGGLHVAEGQYLQENNDWVPLTVVVSGEINVVGIRIIENNEAVTIRILKKNIS
jgi:hypothetical protein